MDESKPLPISRGRDSSSQAHRSTRRHFLGQAGCVLAGTLLPGRSPAAVPEPQPWAGVTELGEGAWAIASTPLEQRDFTTLCNGGIVAGSKKVLMIEAFASPDGARWAAGAARELTGRSPSDIVITHYHGDHTGGLAALISGSGGGDASPAVRGTSATLERVGAAEGASVELVSEERTIELDLGGRSVLIHPLRGHTASDLVVELRGEGILFGGDLLWNRMIPNFVDARPLELKETLRRLGARPPSKVVPGHGPLGGGEVVHLNIALTDAIEREARSSHQEGVTAAQAAQRLVLDDELSSWISFSPNYIERAIASWHRDLGDEAEKR